MNISVFTVSYLNDFSPHVEWLNVYFSSLQNELSGRDVTLNHFIALNEEDKKSARKNISQVISKYSLPFYDVHFLEVDIDPLF